MAVEPAMAGELLGNAVHGVTAEGITPEQAVDEAIAGSSRSSASS